MSDYLETDAWKAYRDLFWPIVEMVDERESYVFILTEDPWPNTYRWRPVLDLNRFQFDTAILAIDGDFLDRFQPMFHVRRKSKAPVSSILGKKHPGLVLDELRKMDIFGVMVDPNYVTTQTLAFLTESDAIVAATVFDGTLEG